MEANSAACGHLCKLCNRRFPCGRSLGGHMRSHLTNNSAENYEKQSRKKPHLPKNYSAGSITNMEEEETDLDAGNLAGLGYVLRKNPKKTQKLEFLDEASVIQDKFCRECGKAFQSWKALFGHMKCHSERGVSSSLEMEEQDSLITFAKQKLVMDIQSDNETETPNKRKRSRRRRLSFMGTANSASLATDSSSVSEIEQEQEVAISLMMLSRDLSNWVGFNSPTELTESSDNNSKFLDRVGSKNSMKKTEPNQPNPSSEKYSKSSKKKKGEFLGSKIIKKPKKRGKFECDICSKIFDSYQALGGHRASHRKLKQSCFSSTMELGSESSAEIDYFIFNPTAESKLSKPFNNGGQSEQEMGSRAKKSSKHKCPICQKVFASGQALGGHKRSHLVNGSDAKNIQQNEEIKDKVAEIREFLDLNLPAPADREIKDPIASLKPWWVGREQTHETLVGFHI